MKKFILLVSLLFFSQVLSAPMSCSGQGAVLSADTMGCGPTGEAHHGPIDSGPRNFKYNLYCKADCQGGAVKLDNFSSLKTEYSRLICQKNVQEETTALRFGKKKFRKIAGIIKPKFGIQGSSSNCSCSALMFGLNFNFF